MTLDLVGTGARVASSMALLCLLAAIAPARADMMPIGVFSVVTTTPAQGTDPGAIGLRLDNYTGDAFPGCCGLPPDFPVLTALTFQNLVLSYVVHGVSLDVSLADLLPGSVIGLEIPDTTELDSASITGSIDPLGFTLFDGSSQNAVTGQFSAQLLPSLSSILSPDVDLTVLAIDAEAQQPAAVPEPGSWLLLVSALAIAFKFRR